MRESAALRRQTGEILRFGRTTILSIKLDVTGMFLKVTKEQNERKRHFVVIHHHQHSSDPDVFVVGSKTQSDNTICLQKDIFSLGNYCILGHQFQQQNLMRPYVLWFVCFLSNILLYRWLSPVQL